jgi:hypothetical protein
MLFIIKSFFIAILIIFIMQVKWGETTIEEKSMSWIANSPIVAPLQDVATGGAKAIREFWKTVTSKVNAKFFKNDKGIQKAGARDLNFTLKRSEQYLNDQANKIKNKTKEYLDQ